MKTALFSLVFALAFLIAKPLHADEVSVLLDKLQIETTNSLEIIKGGKGNPSYEIDRIVNDLARLTKDLSRDTFNAQDAERILTQLATTKLTPEGKLIASKISALLPSLTEANEKDAAARINTVLEKAAAACLSAKKDSDLDEVATELNARRQRPLEYSASAARSRNYAKLEASIRFVGRWQEYLAQAAGGYDLPAKNILHDLADNPNSYPLLTRAQIIAKLGPEDAAETPDVALRAVKNLDDLPPVIAQLSKPAPRRYVMGALNYDSAGVVFELNQINKAHSAFKAGFYNQAIQVATSAPYESGGMVSSVETIRLKNLLLAEVLPRFLDLPGNAEMKPGENASQFLVRLADEATAKGDWDKVQRVLDAYRLSAFGLRAPAWLQGEITACAAFVSGQNFEKAGQFSLAVLSYQNVLKQTGKHVPLKEAGERLAIIKKEHPEAFTAATREEIRDVESVSRPSPRPITAP